MTTKEKAKKFFSRKTETTRDFIKGVNDALDGLYDKFYRYNRKDDGEEYDAGIRWALENIPDVEIATILEYNK